jgi:hypothetical protein
VLHLLDYGDRAELPHLASLFDIDNKCGGGVGLQEANAYLELTAPVMAQT